MAELFPSVGTPFLLECSQYNLLNLLHQPHAHYSLYININPLNAELNPICHLLALLGGATIVVISRLRVKGVSPLCFGTSAESAGSTKYRV
jgi:hypothetical protein